MLLSQVLHHLQGLSTIGFRLPSGDEVPAHFHVTEIAKVQKDFIDCGGKVRQENKIYMQLWSSIDYNHRLHPEKLIRILEQSKAQFNLPNWTVEVEYQGPNTIEQYGLEFKDGIFQLVPTHTDCLAKTSCMPFPLNALKCC